MLRKPQASDILSSPPRFILSWLCVNFLANEHEALSTTRIIR